MFERRLVSPGLSRAPKAESNNGAAITALRVYLLPQPRGSEVHFNAYQLDLNVTGAAPNVEVSICLYERRGALASTGIVFTKVPNTTSIALFLVGPGQTFTLAAATTIPPGHYYVGFIFRELGTSVVTPYNGAQSLTWVTGDWLYNDPGSFTLPATLAGNACSYIHKTGGETPFWCSLTYTGDVIP